MSDKIQRHGKSKLISGVFVQVREDELAALESEIERLKGVIMFAIDLLKEQDAAKRRAFEEAWAGNEQPQKTKGSACVCDKCYCPENGESDG